MEKLRSSPTKHKKREVDFLLPYVRDALLSFIEQSDAFASAVLAEDKTLAGAAEEIDPGYGAISDLEAYRKAVQYFLPGASVDFKMTVIVPRDEDKQPSAKILNLKFEDLFTF